MAQDIKVRVTLDDGKFQQGMQNDAKATQDLGKATRTAAEEISESVRQQVMAVAKSGSYKKELRQTIKELQNLKFAYDNLSDADKNSATGSAMLSMITELRNRAAELKDSMADLNQEVSNLASDTSNFDAFKETISVTRDVFGAMVSSMELVGAETQTLESMMKKLAQIYTVSNALISVGNVLQRNSGVMCKIRTMQEAALAAATRIRTAAEARGIATTKAATAAQALFNTVAKANPYVILGLAVIAAGAALVHYIKKSNEATAAEKKHQEEVKRRQKQMEEYSSSIGSSVGSTIAKYNILRATYKTLRTEHEKKQWIKDNKSAFEQLGLAIKSVNDADRAFIRQSAQVINALKLRAEASALQEIYQEKYKKKVQNDLNPTQANNRIRHNYKAGDEVSINSDIAKRAGLTQVDYQKKKNSGDPTYTGYEPAAKYTSFITEGGAQKLNSLLNREANARKYKEEDEPLAKILQMYLDKQKAATEAESKLGNLIQPKGGNKEDKKEKPLAGSLKDLEEQYNKFEERLANGKLVLNTTEINKQREEFEKKIRDKKIQLGLEPDKETIPGLEKDIKDLQEKLKNNQLTISKDEAEETIKSLQEKLIDLKIQAHVEPDKDSVAALEKRLSNIQNNYKNGWLDISPEKYKEVTTELQKAIDQKSYEMNIKVNPNVEKAKELDKKFAEAVTPQQESSFEVAMKAAYPNPTEGLTREGQNNYELDNIERQMNANDTLLDMLKELAEAYKALGDAGVDGFSRIQEKMQHVNEQNAELSEHATTIEKDNKKIRKQQKTWDAVGDSISGVGSALQALSSASDNDEGTAVAGIIAEAIANVMAGYASATAQASELGPWAWIAFAATGLATALATVSQIKQATSGYASGGIVKGGSYTDGVMAKLSTGEMVLNEHQQSRLWDIISGVNVINESKAGGFVEFKLRGDALYGVLRNYGREQKKVNKDIGIH